MEAMKGNYRPFIHFTPEKGWLNDPNGLVWHDGIYELYYQCNEASLTWTDMHWGHARSRDLLHWERCGIVMAPDENGLMFSGCGIASGDENAAFPKGTLLFPYTAAGRKGYEAHFTIRMACSKDGGNTLEKLPGTILKEISPDNRDPKVFRHEESGAYILVLWIKEDLFGIFRSADLKWFEPASTVRLEGGFECPDLFRLPVYDEKGHLTEEEKWAFWAGDGSYYVGDFDGYTFVQTQRRMRSAANQLPYAAQTWSNDPEKRVLSIAWLRTKCVADLYTGAMSLPHELSLVKRGEYYLLRQRLPDIIPAGEKLVPDLTPDGTFQLPHDGALRLKMQSPGSFTVRLFGKEGELCSFTRKAGKNSLAVKYRGASEFLQLGYFGEVRDIELIYDRGIIEVFANGGESFSVTDLPYLRNAETVKVSVEGGFGELHAGLLV